MQKISAIKKQIEALNWYRQGGAVRPFYVGFPFIGCFNFSIKGKKIKKNFGRMKVFLMRDYFDVYMCKEDLVPIAQYYYIRNKKDGNFMKNLKSSWERDAKNFRIFLQSLDLKDLKKFSNSELRKLYKKFSEKFLSLWGESIFLDSFDLEGENILARVLKKHKVNLSGEELFVLTSPPEYSWLQREKANLIKLSKYVQRHKKLSELIKGGDIKSVETSFPGFFSGLKRHAEDYHWIYNDYAFVKRLQTPHFIEELKNFLLNPVRLRQESRALREVDKMSKRRASLLKSLRLPVGVKNVFDMLVLLAQWRDSRKAYTQIANATLYDLAKEIARRAKIAIMEVEYVFPHEVTSISNVKKVSLKMKNKRMNGCFYSAKGNNFWKGEICGREAIELRKFISKKISSHKLTGKSGFKGVVKGRVRIVLGQQHFKKMRNGDILVAPNTRPEYVPIMKIAGAIITEEGGITSHAAIVSRELRKPSIVGVQGALTALKDHDMVEVDADKGIVRKL